MTSQKYIGNELELFQFATNWKSYFRSQIRAYIRGDVLEVGAGLGGTTRLLANADCRSWTCLEPDAALLSQIESIESELPLRPRCVLGTIDQLPADARFDCILYIDVMEHIGDDAAEFARAAGRLKPGGVLVILSPAHQFLYTNFDRVIGHHRRYTKPSLLRAAGNLLTLERLFYLDSFGIAASLSNTFLKQSMPRLWQIKVWDRCLVPCSRVFDPLLGRTVGKTIIGVWRRDGSA